MKKIKILAYARDGHTAIIKNINAEQLEGTELFYMQEPTDYGYELNYYYYPVTSELFYPYYLTMKGQRWSVTRTTPSEMQAQWQDLKDFCTLEHLLEDMRNGAYFCGNMEIKLCYILGLNELGEELTKRREKQLQEDREKRIAQQKAEQEERERKEREAQERKEKRTQEAIALLREGRCIAAEDFENLCNHYKITLNIKFIGWLRKYCGHIWISNYKEEEKKYYRNKYKTVYGYTAAKHKSTKIFDYADELATALGL